MDNKDKTSSQRFIRLCMAFSLLFMFSCDQLGIESEKRDECIEDSALRKEIIIEGLCGRLDEINSMPPKPVNKWDDPVYNEIMRYGTDMLPCLIEKITDTTMMKNPCCPHPPSEVAVGDVALFLILDISEINFTDLLPPDVEKEYETQGMYAYYSYVKDERSRKDIKDIVVELLEDEGFKR